MIAVSSSGRSFGALAEYLSRGRSGHEHDRVAWSAGLNLPTNDPELAAKIMRATAAQDVRVREPVYHIAISFHPGDLVDRTTMDRVAARVLEALKLQEHQVIIVAHRDRAHPHLHLMVNRVHPETGKVWNRWQDYPVIQRVLREEERALGLREVDGRLHQLPGQEPPERSTVPSGTRREVERTGDPAFIERVRSHVAELRGAESWAELEERLASRGLRLERKGQGLVITDGEYYAKASSVARDFSLRRLEERFGTPFAKRNVERQAQSPVDALTRDLRTYERRSELDHAQYEASGRVSTTKARRDQLALADERVRRAAAVFEGALGEVYRDPRRARAAFEAAMRSRGFVDAYMAMRERPEQFGELRTVERRRALGLTRVDDDGPARRAAPALAGLARRAFDAEQEYWRLVAETRMRRLSDAFVEEHPSSALRSFR